MSYARLGSSPLTRQGTREKGKLGDQTDHSRGWTYRCLSISRKVESEVVRCWDRLHGTGPGDVAG